MARDNQLEQVSFNFYLIIQRYELVIDKLMNNLICSKIEQVGRRLSLAEVEKVQLVSRMKMIMITIVLILMIKMDVERKTLEGEGS